MLLQARGDLQRLQAVTYANHVIYANDVTFAGDVIYATHVMYDERHLCDPDRVFVRRQSSVAKTSSMRSP